ncbi:metalloprotease [Colletotrichum truncatum]|uniref:Metalloprotease n=1 Tax=Colletotrichum truncatum TaxID=5467 RepID=A0ACC3YRZ8_COLTU|nr:metalloprotease [Colletotrichum truncatum]KAF6799373.1 metalloprotease [Colletotrichum truncatum]
MKGLIIALASLAFNGAAATPLYEQRLALRGCLVSEGATPDPASQYNDRLALRQNLPTNFTVDVNFHIASTEDESDLITDEIVDAQWKVLHEAFAKYDINLVLNSTERTVDNLTGSAFLINEGPEKGWVYHEEEYNAYLKASRKGGYDALNLYFFSSYSPGATGYCQWPTPLAETDEETFYKDSCQLSAMTMPGFTVEQGGFEDWNLGHLAIHETGHWFGLNHTFAGGCSETGDFVSDTPAQRTQIYGCPVGSDSCPELPGLDPIHNYMGYTDDSWHKRIHLWSKRSHVLYFLWLQKEIKDHYAPLRLTTLPILLAPKNNATLALFGIHLEVYIFRLFYQYRLVTFASNCFMIRIDSFQVLTV